MRNFALPAKIIFNTPKRTTLISVFLSDYSHYSTLESHESAMWAEFFTRQKYFQKIDFHKTLLGPHGIITLENEKIEYKNHLIMHTKILDLLKSN